MKVRFGILAAVAGVALTGSAQADFVAYNDCSLSGGSPAIPATTTTWGAPGGPGNTGLLKDWATNTNTAVTVTVSGTGGTSNVGPTTEFTAGTAAALVFGTNIVNALGGSNMLIYAGTSWSYDVTFTGLNPADKYTFVTTLDRANAAYTNRWSKITMVNADGSATETTVTGETHLAGGGIAIQSYNTVNGYVAKWSNIAPGADGSFAVHFAAATDADLGFTAGTVSTSAYGPSAFQLTESAVPEPTTLGLLSLAALPLMRRRRA